jgi:hypothetical protein
MVQGGGAATRHRAAAGCTARRARAGVLLTIVLDALAIVAGEVRGAARGLPACCRGASGYMAGPSYGRRRGYYGCSRRTA